MTETTISDAGGIESLEAFGAPTIEVEQEG
jgi:hypothetical protein